MKIKVTVVQKERRSYFDDEEKKMIEFDAEEEIKGEFDSWVDLERFTGIVLRCFPNSIIKIHIEKEAE